MKILIDQILDERGALLAKYGKHASAEYLIEGVPAVSFPFIVSGVDEYKYLTWTFIDHDSNPVCHFSWIHWLVANYEHDNGQVNSNLNCQGQSFNGGYNSYASPLGGVESEIVKLNYGGPMPPNCDHNYTLVVYAHNERLELSDGFHLNDLYDQLEQVDYRQSSIKIISRK